MQKAKKVKNELLNVDPSSGCTYFHFACSRSVYDSSEKSVKYGPLQIMKKLISLATDKQAIFKKNFYNQTCLSYLDVDYWSWVSGTIRRIRDH